MKFPKEFSLILALFFTIVPGLMIMLFGFGVPPHESPLLFGGFIEVTSVLLLFLLWMNRQKVRAISTGRVNRWVITLFLVTFITCFVYMIISDYCVVTYPDRSPTFFPLWLSGELAENLNKVGSRQKFLGTYGSDQVRILIDEFSKTSLTITRVLMIVFLELTFLPLVVAFFLLSNKISETGIGKEQFASDKIEVFFSYAWGMAREKIVDDLYDALQKEKDFKLIRDKMDMEYKGLISEFMQRIGAARLVVIVLSEKYLHSEYCMFELYEIFRNARLNKKELLEKIFPIKIEELNLSDPGTLKEYFKYWKDLEIKWKELVNEYGADQAHHRRIEAICLSLRDLLPFLNDINALNPVQLSQNNFSQIKEAIRKQIRVN